MPARSVTLSDGVDEYETHRRTAGVKPSTLRIEVQYMRRVLAHIGNIQLKHITDRHIDEWMFLRKGQVQPSTWNHELSILKRFFKWAERRRYTTSNPTDGRRGQKYVEKTRMRIPVHDFPRVLDAAKHPTDRIIVALGMYLCLRQSEVRELRVGDVNLATGEITVRVPKTNDRDVMPISLELDRELRRWYTVYTTSIERPLEATDFLAPAKLRQQIRDHSAPVIDPYRPALRPYLAVQRTLDAAGYDLRDPVTGESNREGVHTLRRSAARAIFDRLVDDGYDGALRTVQSLLHHSTTVMTERYLDLNLDRKRRDELFRGKALYGNTAPENVTQLRVG